MGFSTVARAAIRYLLRGALGSFCPPRTIRATSLWWTQVNAREIYPEGQINLPRITRPSLSYSLKYFTRTSDRIFPIRPSGRALSISRSFSFVVYFVHRWNGQSSIRGKKCVRIRNRYVYVNHFEIECDRPWIIINR